MMLPIFKDFYRTCLEFEASIFVNNNILIIEQTNIMTILDYQFFILTVIDKYDKKKQEEEKQYKNLEYKK